MFDCAQSVKDGFQSSLRRRSWGRLSWDVQFLDSVGWLIGSLLGAGEFESGMGGEVEVIGATEASDKVDGDDLFVGENFGVEVGEQYLADNVA